MVTEFGMSDALGPLAYGKRHGPIFLARELAEERNYSEEIAHQIDVEVRRIIDECFDRATSILSEHRDRLELLVEVLLRKETLDQQEVATIVETGQLPGGEAAEEADDSDGPETPDVPGVAGFSRESAQ